MQLFSLPLCLLALAGALTLSRSADGQEPAGERAFHVTGPRAVALVIGNDAYEQEPLKNARADAEDVADFLETVGFAVTLRKDVPFDLFETQVEAFLEQQRDAEVALFFFAGHGLEVDGYNYLLPVDITPINDRQFEGRACNANDLMERMENSGARLRILILDACRENPFRKSRSGNRSWRTTSHGLAAMAGSERAIIDYDRGDVVGTYVAFATSPGGIADDNGHGRNGLFSGTLLAVLNEPGRDLNSLFEEVRRRVVEASGQKQWPWTSSNVIGKFYFRQPDDLAQQTPLPAPSPAPPAPSPGRSCGGSEDDLRTHLRGFGEDFVKRLQTAYPFVQVVDPPCDIDLNIERQGPSVALLDESGQPVSELVRDSDELLSDLAHALRSAHHIRLLARGGFSDASTLELQVARSQAATRPLASGSWLDDGEVVFWVRSRHLDKLVLLEVGPTGDVRVVFPHREGLSNRIATQQQIRIPQTGSYTITGPPGKRRFFALTYRGSGLESGRIDYRLWDYAPLAQGLHTAFRDRDATDFARGIFDILGQARPEEIARVAFDLHVDLH